MHYLISSKLKVLGIKPIKFIDIEGNTLKKMKPQLLNKYLLFHLCGNI